MPIRRCSLLIAALCTFDAMSSQSLLVGEQGVRPAHHATPALRSAVHNGKARKAKKVHEPALGDFAHPAWLQTCKSIFLDLGSNNGVNIRKMYEPEKYGGAKLLPYLEEVFGRPEVRRGPALKTGLCALGLEPNPQRHGRLQMVQQAYGNQGWNVHFYPFAAWSKDGFMPLNMTGKKKPTTQLKAGEGSHLAARSAGHVQTRTVDLAAFINSLPAQSVKLMIMDIEGAEYQSLAQLIQKNVLCRTTVHKALIAAHAWGEITHWGDNSTFHVGVHPRSFLAIRQRLDQLKEYEWCAPGKVTDVAELDDSMYSQDLLDSPLF